MRRVVQFIGLRLHTLSDWLLALWPDAGVTGRSSCPQAVRKPVDWGEKPYSEKVAWRCRNPDPTVDYAVWADKDRVKTLVAGMFSVPATYRVVREPDAIDAEILPETFVMKATHGWDMSLLVEGGIVQGGNRTRRGAGQPCTSDILRQTARGWLASYRERRRQRRERHYRYVRPGILFEQFIAPVDYELQLFLFNGRCRLAMVLYRGFHHINTAYRLYDENWQPLEPGQDKGALCHQHGADDVARPPADVFENLQRLCQGIDHVRADFLVCGDRYYFSEFTFTHNSLGGPGFIGDHDRALGLFWV